MNIVGDRRRIEITVQKVDSIPCSLVGNKMIFSMDGTMVTEPWKFPWPMPWVEQVFREFAKENISFSKNISTRLYNPEEPDQYLEISARSYINLTVGQLVDEISDCYPDREALVSNTGSRRFRYAEFKKITTDLAKGLISIGTEKNDKISIWAVNSPEFVMAQFGVSKTGGIMVPLNAHEKQMRIETLLKHSDTRTLIMQVGSKATENIEILYKICPELCECMPGNLKSEKLPMLKNVIVISDEEYPGTYRWSDILDQGERQNIAALEERENQIHIDDVVHIIYTSGTTGTPKGVMLSHGNVLENAKAMSTRMALTEKDIMCVQAPLFHCFGSVACTITAVISGCSMVMVDKFRPEITLSLIERERCTVVSGVPTLFIAFINELQKAEYQIDSIRTGIVAGAPCTSKMMNEIKSILGIENIIVSYGLTEASPCVTAICGCDSFELRTATVGKPIPGVELKIVDFTTREEVPPRQDGEILVRGYNVMKGYYKMPEETDQILDPEGWLHTGDIGYMLENGYLCIKDRCKDVIIRSGENISPKEIEDYLITHGDVAEVNVIGVPNYLCGEEIMAFIKLKKGRNITENEIKIYSKGKLATNKIPKYVTFVEEFPLSESGKVLKTALREAALEIIGHDEVNHCEV